MLNAQCYNRKLLEFSLVKGITASKWIRSLSLAISFSSPRRNKENDTEVNKDSWIVIGPNYSQA